jgi:hypothetical protein
VQWSEQRRTKTVKKISQLGEQPEQSLPPFRVLSKEDEELAKIIQDTGLTSEQLLRVADIP